MTTAADGEGRPVAQHEASASEGGAGAPPDPVAPNRAPDLTREYRAEGITVQWYAGRCIHSANCVRSLPRVFAPERRPWVEPAAATTLAENYVGLERV